MCVHVICVLGVLLPPCDESASLGEEDEEDEEEEEEEEEELL